MHKQVGPFISESFPPCFAGVLFELVLIHPASVLSSAPIQRSSAPTGSTQEALARRAASARTVIFADCSDAVQES